MYNSYLVYKANVEKSLSFLEYKNHLIFDLLDHEIIDNKSDGDEYLSTSSHRLKGKHFLERIPNLGRRDCVVCSENTKKRVRSSYQCKTCIPKVALCEIDCFESYHTKVIYRDK